MTCILFALIIALLNNVKKVEFISFVVVYHFLHTVCAENRISLLHLCGFGSKNIRCILIVAGGEGNENPWFSSNANPGLETLVLAREPVFA